MGERRGLVSVCFSAFVFCSIRLTSDHDEGDAVRQGEGQAEGVELWLDRRIAVHGGSLCLLLDPSSFQQTHGQGW